MLKKKKKKVERGGAPRPSSSPARQLPLAVGRLVISHAALGYCSSSPSFVQVGRSDTEPLRFNFTSAKASAAAKMLLAAPSSTASALLRDRTSAARAAATGYHRAVFLINIRSAGRQVQSSSPLCSLSAIALASSNALASAATTATARPPPSHPLGCQRSCQSEHC